MLQPAGTTAAAHRRDEWALLVAMVLIATAVAAGHVSYFWKYSFLFHFGPLMAGLALVGVINAALMVGYRNALVFLLIAAVIGYTAEQVGIMTGWVFGPYYYTDKLGFKIGDVPWVIPLCWFALVYFAHVITNLALHAHPVAPTHNWIHAALLAIITALIATGFDVAMDPAMSHPLINTWVWSSGGEYMGVPFKNFRGWVATAFLIDLLYRLFSGRFGTRPISQRARATSMTLLLTWFALGLAYILIGLPIATQLIAVFCIVLPGLIALTALYARAWNPVAAAERR